jgi:predicted GNAT family acetyltransferase
MITNNTSKSRYELSVDGHLAIADYRLEGDKLKIMHVETPPELRGQGIAAKVMEGVVEDAKARGLTIVPVCSYAVSYLKKLSS